MTIPSIENVTESQIDFTQNLYSICEEWEAANKEKEEMKKVAKHENVIERKLEMLYCFETPLTFRKGCKETENIILKTGEKVSCVHC